MNLHASLRFPPLVRKTVGPKTKTRKQARHGTSEASLSFLQDLRRSNRGAGGSNCCASSERELMAFKALLQETMQLDPLISRQVCHRRPLQNLACSREPAMDDVGRGQEAGLLAVLHRTCVCRDMVNGQADDLMHLFMNIAQARPTAGSTARNASCLRKIVLCLQALCVIGAFKEPWHEARNGCGKRKHTHTGVQGPMDVAGAMVAGPPPQWRSVRNFTAIELNMKFHRGFFRATHLDDKSSH